MRPHTLLLLALLLTPSYTVLADTITTCPDQCGGYSNIQDAVNKANPGDTLVLEPGVYQEAIVVNKSITIRGSGNQTIIHGAGPNPVFTVTADNVKILDLQAIYSLYGVQAKGVIELEVRGCNFYNNSMGVYLESCTEVSIEDCNFKDERSGGLYIQGSANVTVSGCHFTESLTGIHIMTSGANTITDSRFSGLEVGILFEGSNYNTVQECTFTVCSDAVITDLSGGNTLSGNSIQHCARFIGSYLSRGNQAENNQVDAGVYAYDMTSTRNLYRFDDLDIMGQNYIISFIDFMPQAGYKVLNGLINVTMIQTQYRDSYVTLTVSIPEGQYIGREPEDLAIYRHQNNELVELAQGYLFNSTVAVNTTVYSSGLYSLTLRFDNEPPTAKIRGNPTTSLGDEAFFDATESEDNVGIVEYTWDFGDGTQGSGEQVSHTYDEEGDYLITLTVTDSFGNSDTDTMTVTASEEITSQAPNYQMYLIVAVLLLVGIGLFIQWRREKSYIQDTS